MCQVQDCFHSYGLERVLGQRKCSFDASTIVILTASKSWPQVGAMMQDLCLYGRAEVSLQQSIEMLDSDAIGFHDFILYSILCSFLSTCVNSAAGKNWTVLGGATRSALRYFAEV